MKKIAVIISILVLIVSSLAMIGCGSEQAMNKKVAIAFADSSPSWQRNGNTLRALLEEDGFTVEIRYTNDENQQIEDIKELVDGKPACLLVGPLNSDNLVDALAKAKENNVPVIAYDRIINNTDAVSYLASYDGYAIGFAMGKYIETALQLKTGAGPFNIELFAGGPTDPNSPVFFQESMKILKPYIDNGQLICRSGEITFDKANTKDWEPKNAMARMDKIYKQYYTDGAPIHAILSPNDGIAQGILSTLAANGYTGPGPIISGLDADPAALKSIAEGKQTFTVAKDPDQLAAKCVRMIKAVVEGTAPAVNDVKSSNNGVMIIPAYLCVPQIIDKENVDQYLK